MLADQHVRRILMSKMVKIFHLPLSTAFYQPFCEQV